MTKSRTLRKAGAVTLALAMAASTAFSGSVSFAKSSKSKVTLSATSKTFAAKGGTKTVKIKGASAGKISSTKLSTTKKAVATAAKVKKSKVKFKVTANKNTTTKAKKATIKAKVTIKKKYQKKYTKKSYTLKFAVTVKAKTVTPTEEPEPTVEPTAAPTEITGALKYVLSNDGKFFWIVQSDGTVLTLDLTTSGVTDAEILVGGTFILVDANGKAYSLTITSEDAAKIEKSDVPPTEPVKGLTAAQTGAKKFTVTAEKAIPSTAKITVLKGTVETKATAEIADNTAIVTLDANITADSYTIKVDDAEIIVTGEASKLTKIDIPSDVAVADADLPTTTKGSHAVVGYVATNQFEENITADTKINSVTCSGATAAADQAKGKITIDLPVGAKADDPYQLVVVNNTGVSCTKTVKLTAKGVISNVKAGALYNADGKTLTEDTNLATDKFYQLFELTDQYGEAITDSTQATKETIVTAVPGLTGATATTISTIKVDGKDTIAIEINNSSSKVKAGKGGFLVIAKATGNKDQSEFEVKDGIKVDTFTASAPSLVVSGEPVNFTFTATDTYGDAIADPTAAMFTNKQIPAGYEFVKDAATGKTVLKYKANQGAGNKIDTFITATGKVVNVSFTVQEPAKPVAISGLDSDVVTNILAKGSENTTIAASKVKFVDSYGRSMTAVNALKGDYSLKVTPVTTGSNIRIQGVDTSSSTAVTTISASDVTVTATTGGVLFTSLTGTADTVKVKFTLYNGASPVEGEGASIEVSVKSIAMTSFKSYEIGDYSVIPGYAGAPDRKLKVFAKDAAGNKVLLPSTEYTAYGNSVAGNSGAGFTITGSALYAADEAVTEKSDKIDVVINDNDATTVSKTFKFSNAKPVATTLTPNDKFVANDYKIAGGVGPVSADELKNMIDYKDQYGDNFSKANIRITIKVAPTITVNHNGNVNAELVSMGVKDVTDITFYSSDALKLTTTFGVKAAVS